MWEKDIDCYYPATEVDVLRCRTAGLYGHLYLPLLFGMVTGHA